MNRHVSRVPSLALVGAVALAAGIVSAADEGPIPTGNASSGSTAAHTPVAEIGEAAKAFLRTRHADDPSLAIAGGGLDERLRLARCAAPLETRLAPGSRDIGRVTVRVSCPAAPSWRVHVQLEATRERELWTFVRAVRRGERLEPAMLVRRRVTLGREASRFARGGTPIDSPAPWRGHELARDARAGDPLTTSLLTPRRLIERGASVRVRAEGSGLRIETRGVALADGAIGERVTVRNAVSGRIVEGRVEGPGTVVVSRAASVAEPLAADVGGAAPVTTSRGATRRGERATTAGSGTSFFAGSASVRAGATEARPSARVRPDAVEAEESRRR